MSFLYLVAFWFINQIAYFFANMFMWLLFAIIVGFIAAVIWIIGLVAKTMRGGR